ncbi:hypothetical protein M422DRAFT_250182 [Sphaerobolus stellatus SS14]|uniref:Uncharacterized protein n=1 Tax=Sphaerobolus stellatus (strain SS14) TaxID=990650 RepID=A0A0C9UTH1_SPHS4|nr:hypothetical protein M422DRAFT_250182 [Sphaerobolus stellatus SS14]
MPGRTHQATALNSRRGYANGLHLPSIGPSNCYPVHSEYSPHPIEYRSVHAIRSISPLRILFLVYPLPPTSILTAIGNSTCYPALAGYSPRPIELLAGADPLRIRRLLLFLIDVSLRSFDGHHSSPSQLQSVLHLALRCLFLVDLRRPLATTLLLSPSFDEQAIPAESFDRNPFNIQLQLFLINTPLPSRDGCNALSLATSPSQLQAAQCPIFVCATSSSSIFRCRLTTTLLLSP